ncbi:hypothetical protein CPB84DRAFT_1750924 [Gymnopilus junonius]|uniref:Uncharacterized protein n=1 Tax=Gymnopilus junonius TaxID=109634 RepID=A0A9P5NCS4_GYMJU|nr:hypothetical protein CPB84DRAFT_1750924 [Gymnopilus junonius]
MPSPHQQSNQEKRHVARRQYYAENLKEERRKACEHAKKKNAKWHKAQENDELEGFLATKIKWYDIICQRANSLLASDLPMYRMGQEGVITPLNGFWVPKLVRQSYSSSEVSWWQGLKWRKQLWSIHWIRGKEGIEGSRGQGKNSRVDLYARIGRESREKASSPWPSRNHPNRDPKVPYQQSPWPVPGMREQRARKRVGSEHRYWHRRAAQAPAPIFAHRYLHWRLEGGGLDCLLMSLYLLISISFILAILDQNTFPGKGVSSILSHRGKHQEGKTMTRNEARPCDVTEEIRAFSSGSSGRWGIINRYGVTLLAREWCETEWAEQSAFVECCCCRMWVKARWNSAELPALRTGARSGKADFTIDQGITKSLHSGSQPMTLM